jgi:HD-like signal output (HDOD) protein
MAAKLQIFRSASGASASFAAKVPIQSRSTNKMTTAPDLVGQTPKLPSLPAVYLQLRQALNDPAISIAQLGDLISHDPALAARLLQVVNSPLYGLPGRVHTVSRAIAILGMHQVHDLVIASCLTTTFRNVRPAEMDMARFWYGSMFRALAARHLARACRCIDPERPFINGLLSDLGHLILYLNMPIQALEAQRLARQTGMTLVQAERQLIGCDYAEVGGELLSTWHLPPAICTAVRQHAEPSADGAYALEAAIIHIAAFVAGVDAGQPNPLGPDIAPAAWRATGLDGGMVPLVSEKVASEIDAVVELFFPRSAAA